MKKKQKNKQFREVAVMDKTEHDLLIKLAKKLNVPKSRAMRIALANEEYGHKLIGIDTLQSM